MNLQLFSLVRIVICCQGGEITLQMHRDAVRCDLLILVIFLSGAIW